MEGLIKLKEKFPFPAPSKKLEKKLVGGRPKGWCHVDNTNHFRLLSDKNNPVIIDGGSYMGLSAWWWLNIYPESTVICIDHWKGSAEHQSESMKEEIANLYDYFLTNLEEYKNRVIPIKENSSKGMAIVKEFGVIPDIVWIDWSHDELSVFSDVLDAIELFPDSIICGDDYTWDGVKAGLESLKAIMNVKLYSSYSFWRVDRD